VALNAPVFRDPGPQPDAEFQYSLQFAEATMPVNRSLTSLSHQSAKNTQIAAPQRATNPAIRLMASAASA
jgi:hypothetical protein